MIEFIFRSQLANWIASVVLGLLGGWSALHGYPIVNLLTVASFFLYYQERHRRELKRLGLERDHFRNCLKRRSEQHLIAEALLETAQIQNDELRAELDELRAQISPSSASED